MSDTFAVHLGGGAYLDASGKIVFGAPSKAQIYQAPGGFKLPVDPNTIKDTLGGLANILPSNDEDKKKWKEWGVPEDVVKFLSNIAGYVGVAATAVSVYAWAIGVMLTIMKLINDDDGISPELAKVLFGIKAQLHGIEQIQRADKMIEMHADFDGRIDLVSGLLTRLSLENPTGSARAKIFAEMRDIVGELAVPLSNLRNQEWASTYDVDAYSGRAFAHQLLVFERSDGSLAPVPMVSPDVTFFDYRLGVPMLLYGSTTFTALIQIAMPWFRSAGMYAKQLQKTADAIDRFVLRMQDESICRTEYSAGTVLEQKIFPIFQISAKRSLYAVGAFDLVRYNDTFLSTISNLDNWSQHGLFNYEWRPYYGIPPTPEPSLSDVASAANEQARQDYAKMQVTTGMLHLISTAAWLRFLSTPPNRSQTVSGFTRDSCYFLDEAPTTAISPNIYPIGVIKHDATLKRYDAQNRIRVTTQEPGYVPAFNYRIVLRTINSNVRESGWDNQEYIDKIWRTSYEPTQGDPRCKRLRTEVIHDLILDEIVLYEGPSPTQTVTRPGKKSLKASTFDWYVPLASPWYAPVASPLPWSSFVATKESAAKIGSGAGQKTMLGTGGVSIHLLADELSASLLMDAMDGPAPLVGTNINEAFDPDNIVTIANAALDKAERRHVKIEDVEVRWQLNWTADKLEVKLFGRPEDRPFQVHLVVEETVYSGEISLKKNINVLTDKQVLEQIHTPFVAEIVNQLVFVPEEFFREEFEALKQNAKTWNRFLYRFIERGPISPGDPIEFLQKSIRELTTHSLSTSTLTTKFNMQAEFAMSQAPELWQTAIKETYGNTMTS